MEETLQYIKADFHVHTSFSRRVTASPEEMYKAAREKGLEKIAVTDHNTIKGALRLAENDPDFIIVGEEITWDARGEIIGLFMKEAIPEGKSAAYTLDALHEQNAFVFIPHPFAPFHFFCPPGNILKMADRIDAVEIRNGRNFRFLNACRGVCDRDLFFFNDPADRTGGFRFLHFSAVLIEPPADEPQNGSRRKDLGKLRRHEQ